MPGSFLNPVAFSNIEPYPMTCGRSGAAPRPLILRSSFGILVTMQPSIYFAQSMPMRLQAARTQPRPAR
ncbi:hypothetical protein OKW38_002941 [Paraburkholderia sp. MM5496-R1]|uniref:Uncharacterized protein n=1 Tax=Paraburkholderia tuberum TaxID=157910 RepID=A0A1H1FLV4_9BURK|nr:hypothetical protein SAMN05445850_2463 [Paraburkholderia tuberum]